jgi:xanthine dehydrogenase iron-sulfur cluster and FAD-binding subunit A
MWKQYYTPSSVEQVLGPLTAHGAAARIVAGATDLILELERGLRPGVEVLIDVSRLPGLDTIGVDQQGWIHLGPLVTHNHVAVSPLIVENAFVLARACWEVGAPQIRNRGTVAGNLITASPANDSIPPLMALGAVVRLRSRRGERRIPLGEFYAGVRRTVMEPDEWLTDIAFPVPEPGTRSTFFKLALRRAQAISVVNAAVLLELDGQRVRRAAITLGAVAPTIVRAPEAEEYLAGKELLPSVVQEAARRAVEAARPIDDLRATAAYRRDMVEVSVRRCLRSLAAGRERESYPAVPVTLWGRAEPHVLQALRRPMAHHAGTPIETMINGVRRTFAGGQEKTLLRLLREDGLLVGTKEGCAEGECGACTVLLDGMAVMACMVPAPRAHGAQIRTVEGLADGDRLHPLQQAFVQTGAVQCGYCTPGFLMSGAALLEERPRPTRAEIEQALTGNLCRCTGYYSIIEAVERAAALG